MDIQADKLSLIEWIAGINDSRIINQFKSLQKSNQEQANASLSQEENQLLIKG